MALSKVKCAVVVGCLSLAIACGDDDGDDDDVIDDGGAMDAGDAGTGGDAGDAGKLDGGGDGSLMDAASDASSDGARPDASSSSDAGTSPLMSFFVTSDTRPTGDLGGLMGADMRCQTLAAAVGAGNKTWRAYLSVERDPSNNDMPTHAGTRIGTGPWHNARGVLLANDLAELHALKGNAELFLDEHGAKINGQWVGSPSPNQHDILTGTDADGGVVPGKTCDDWTSDSDEDVAVVGHSDGLGPMQDAAPPRNSWHSAHDNQDCSDTAPRGGAGKIYCFARN